MLGQPMSMLIPQVVGFKLARRAARGRDRDRPRAHRHRDAAQERRRRQVRRVLRPRRLAPAAGRPRDDRQHEPGVRLDLRDLPDRRRDAALPARSPGARRSTSTLVEAYAKEQGLWHDENAEEPTYSDTLELDLGDVVPVAGRPQAPAGPRAAARRQGRASARRWPTSSVATPTSRSPTATTRRSPRPSRPPTRPANGAPGHEPDPHEPAAAPAVAAGTVIAERSDDRGRGHARRRDVRARPRPRRDRRDHVVHEHLEPVGDARRRPAGPQRRRRAA